MYKLSVIMSVYRENEKYLRESIESVLNQSYKDFEFIIVLDDSQNDAAFSIIKNYESSDSRIRVVINESNIGLALSLNKAARLACGKYLVRMDADDISLPGRFQKQLEFMDKNPQISVLGINKIEIDEKGHITAKGSKLPATVRKTSVIMKYSNIILHSGVFIRKEDFFKVGGYRDFPASQDYDLWLRFISGGYKIVNLNEYLIKYRTSPYNISISRAYLQELIAIYIRRLYKERVHRKDHSDSYSSEELKKILDKDKDDFLEAQCYQNGRLLYLEGKTELKHHNFFKGIYLIREACNKHSLISNYARREMVCALLKRVI